MPEYNKSICRSCFHSYVCEEFNADRYSNNKKCHYFNDYYVPAADVVEVVHGRWKKHKQSEDVYICSECCLNVDDFEIRWLNYCPNCGADMRRDTNG